MAGDLQVAGGDSRWRAGPTGNWRGLRVTAGTGGIVQSGSYRSVDDYSSTAVTLLDGSLSQRKDAPAQHPKTEIGP